MAQIDRQIDCIDTAFKDGGRVAMPLNANLPSGGVPSSAPYLVWAEDSVTLGLEPPIPDQIFHLIWPLITGTDNLYTSLAAALTINDVSLDILNVTTFENVPPEWTLPPPAVTIFDSGAERTEPFDKSTQSWVRIQQTATTVTVSLGPDGVTWPAPIAYGNRPLPPGYRLNTLSVGMRWGTLAGSDPPDDAIGYVSDWSPPLPPDFGSATYTVADPPQPVGDETLQTPRMPRIINPYAVAPAVDKECATLLDLIREFSASVRCPVRIVNGSTIEMVDPNEPLPDGWNAGLARSYYTSTTHAVQASTAVLSLANGYMDLTVSADILGDDVGIITGGFRIPNRLPVPDLDPAPVSRVSYTFTPTAFRASVEMTFPDTPLVVRKR